MTSRPSNPVTFGVPENVEALLQETYFEEHDDSSQPGVLVVSSDKKYLNFLLRFRVPLKVSFGVFVILIGLAFTALNGNPALLKQIQELLIGR